MNIYSLTPRGSMVARNVSNPSSPAYRVIHFLDGVGQSTSEQIANYCGMSHRETSQVLYLLRRKGFVTEASDRRVAYAN